MLRWKKLSTVYNLEDIGSLTRTVRKHSFICTRRWNARGKLRKSSNRAGLHFLWDRLGRGDRFPLTRGEGGYWGGDASKWN